MTVLEDDAKFDELVTAQPANAELVMWLKTMAETKPVERDTARQWPAEVPLIDRHPYVLHTHPDLAGLLMNVAEELPGHYSQLLFGYHVMANQVGVVCAVAASINDLIFRLPEHARKRAMLLGGRTHPELGGEWIVFDAWFADVSAGEPENVNEIPPDCPGCPPRDIRERRRIAFFRIWCEEAWAYVNTLRAAPS